MRERRPVQYAQFACIGSACRDNCCIGWEICIDEDTIQRYSQLPEKDSRWLQDGICFQETPSFQMEKGRCVFLNEENLCRIHLRLGEDFLCRICREHPRYHHWFGDYKESGLGLCCQEACRLLLGSPVPITWEVVSVSEEGEPLEGDPALLQMLLETRETAFSLLQDRSLPLFERVALLLAWGEELQTLFEAEDIFEEFPKPEERMESLEKVLRSVRKVKQVYDAPEKRDDLLKMLKQYPRCQETREALSRKILEFYRSLEVLEAPWKERLNSLWEQEIQLPKAFEKAYIYENFLVYWIDRYWVECFWNGDLLSWVRGAAAGCWLVGMLAEASPAESPEDAAEMLLELFRKYAKEVEYSQENLSALEDECWMGEAFSLQSFLTLYLGSKE